MAEVHQTPDDRGRDARPRGVGIRGLDPGSGSAGEVMAINGGSSSIRFAVYALGPTLEPRLRGKLDRIGRSGTVLRFRAGVGEEVERSADGVKDHDTAAGYLLDWLESRDVFSSLRAVAHRLVHGLQHVDAQPVTAALLDELHRAEAFAPEHLPVEIALIEALRRRRPGLLQVACFDTAFHRSMPPVARRIAIPRRYEAQGVQRYGFHGLSYAYLVEELVRLEDPAATRGRVILAHLGNGASLAAVRDGKSIDTTMGFSPASGMPMGSRCGDVDPALAGFLARTEGMSTARFQQMTSHESGLLGVSGTSSDMRDLLAERQHDAHAAEAVELFCYQARKWIGAYAAALGGLDTLVFAGGIGENIPQIRDRICAGLEFLGIRLADDRNAINAPVISADGGGVTVRVVPTDEESMLARLAAGVLCPSGRPAP